MRGERGGRAIVAREPQDPSRRVFEEGSRRHPGVALPFERFAPAWREMRTRREARKGPASEGASDGCAEGSAADQFLAIACDRGAPGAWERLTSEYGDRLFGLLRRRGCGEAEAREIVADLAGYLTQAPRDGDARTRIGTYHGSASLFSWMAVIALRQARRNWGATPRAPTGADDGVVEKASRRDVPANAALGRETATRFSPALARAWDALTARERLAVLLRYREGLRGTEIARVLGVSEPRVSRLLEAGLSRLRDGVRQSMPGTPPGTDSGQAAVWQALGEVLARFLATLGPLAHESGEGSGG